MESFCPILGRIAPAESTPYFRDEWKVLRCKETGFYFLADPPEYELLESEYEWDNSYHCERERRKTVEPVYARISEASKQVRKAFTLPRRNKFYTVAKHAISKLNHDKPFTFLDVGCGTGKLIQQLYDRFQLDGIDIIPSGIEISNHLSAVSREVVQPLGGQLIHASAIGGASECDAGSFDVILMRSFLEHERRPLELLAALRHSLTLDGVIIIKVPNFACWNRIVRGSKWCGFRYPDHVNYFTPATMKILAKEAGYSMQSGILDHFPLSDNMYVQLRSL